MTLELRQLRYFVAVAEERHFGRAAVRLGIAQPGLSQQIKRLERSIGTQLFLRDKRHVELTKAGEVLLDSARLAIEQAERAIQCTRAAAFGKTGLLKVGANARRVYPVGDELLREFADRFPHVEIEFHSGRVQHSIDELLRRRIDVAIVFAPYDAPDHVRYLRLGAVEALIAVPSRHPLAKIDRIPRSALLSETFFAFPRHLNPPLVDHLRTSLFGGVEHPRLVEVAENTDLLMHVGAGEGIAAVDPSLVELEISNVAFRRLEDPAPEFDYGLVWLDSAISPFLTWFLELAREVADRPPPRKGRLEHQ